MTTWQSRVRDLQAIGLKQSEIGTHCGMATSTVSDIANGRIKEPGGDAAVKMHILHAERCNQPAQLSA